jgi:hypothetical protein
MSVGRELETFRHADVIGRDALPRCYLSGAQEGCKTSEDQSQAQGAMRLHASCFLGR